LQSGPPTPPFYYPQVWTILAMGIFLEKLDVCFDKLLDDFPNASIIGNHLSDSGQLSAGNVDDSRFLPTILTASQ